MYFGLRELLNNEPITCALTADTYSSLIAIDRQLLTNNVFEPELEEWRQDKNMVTFLSKDQILTMTIAENMNRTQNVSIK